MPKPISLESPDLNTKQPMTTLDQLALSIGMGNTTSNPQNFTFGDAPSSLSTQRPLTALEANAAFANIGAYAYNPIKMSRPGTFGAGQSGIDMERYMAHPNFESFGVSAFRDNEAFYNQHGTWGSDFIRANKYILPAIGDFAWEHLTNYDLNNWSPDLESSSAYQDHMHKMMSTKGGVEGWLTNFGANMAPTIGILAGVGVEFAATSAIAAVGSRFGLGTIAAEAGSEELARGAKALTLLDKWKQVRGVVNEFGAAVDVSAARQAFNVSKEGVGYFLKNVNPLANTLDAVQDIQNGSKTLAYMGNMARVSKTFGGMWRDVQNYRFVLNEANLEGGSAYLDQIDNGIKKFQLENNGEMPTGADADQILKLAEDNGRAVQWENMALIHLTNSFGLNKLVGKLGEKAGIRSAFTANFNKYLVEKSIKGVAGASTKAGYELLENNIKKWGSKAYYKYLLHNSPSDFLRYFATNFMEGAQEIGQEAIVKGTEHYFAEQLKDPYRIHKELLKESIATGFGSQMSADGLNVFAQGFLTGGVMNTAQSSVLSPIGDFVYSKWDPKGFKEKLDAAEEQANRLLTSANLVFENKAEVFKILDSTAGHLTNMARASQVAQAIGDERAMRDLKEDTIFSHVYSLWRGGRTDILKDQLKQLGMLEADELADALGEYNASPEEKLQLHGRINNAIKKVDKIKSDLDKINKKVVNPYQPWEINRKLNPEAYQQEYDMWQSVEDGKYFAVFASHSFNRAGERMEGLMQTFINNAAFSKTTGMNIGRLFSVEQMQNDAESLREQAKIFRENNNAKKANELDTMAKKLENLSKNSNLFSVILGLSNRSEKLTDGEKEDLKPILDKAREQGIDLENISDDDVQEIQNLLKSSFSSYLNELLFKNNNGRAVIDDEVNELFEQYSDWHKLGDDTRVMAKFINMLADPEGFNKMQNVTRQARQRVYDDRKNILKEQRARFYKKIIQNKFLQELFDQYGVMVSKDDVEAFANNDRYPQLIDKNTLEPLKANDPRIAGIEELFDMYEEAENRLVNTRPIREDRGENAMLSMLASLANAEKSLGDKRSYDDLAKALGIDPNDLETQLESSKVFDFIINSKFASAAEKKLAQRLKEKYPNAKVTFKKNHHSAMTYNESSGIIIDLRFAASNYQSGKTRAEYIMLKGLMTAMTTSFLSNDPAFLKDIQTLREEVENAINADPSLLDTFGKKSPLGLLSDQEFVQEAMVNPAFQALLNRIKSKQSKKANVFEDFLKATRAFLKKLFNIKTANNSVLTQAVAVISNKIYSTDYQAKKTETPQAPPAAPSSSAPAGTATPLTDEEKIKAISQSTPIKDMPQELVDLLDEEYKKIIKLSRGTYSKTGFAAFVASAPKAASVIEKWKRDEIKKLKGPAPTTGKKGASPKDDDDEPNTISDDQRQALYNLGYSRRDIDGYENEDGEIVTLIEPEDYDDVIKTGLRRPRAVAEGEFEEADAMIEGMREKLAEKEFPEDQVTDKGYTDENGVNWPRVSELLNKNFVNKDGTTRGTILDTVYREFMMDKINSVQELTARIEELSVDEKGKRLFTYSKGFVVNLYDSMQEVHDFISSMGYKIIADIPTLWGEIDGRRAGTIDFLIYNEDKEFGIVDLKTSTVNLRRAYEDPSKDTYEYQKGHTIQQNGYRELFGQRTGLTPNALFVLPLLLKKNKAGTYDGIKTLPSKSGSLMLPVSMDQDIYSLTGVAKSPAAFAPEGPTPTTKPPKKKKKKTAKKPADQPVEETTLEKVARFRAEEQDDLLNAIPNIESYKVDGKIDKKLMPAKVKKAYERIYDKYDAIITPLLKEQINTEVMEALSKVQDEDAFTGARELTAKEKAQQEKIIAEITNKYLPTTPVATTTTIVAPEIVKGSVIRMNNGELVKVKNITKGKITVVPLMDDTAAEDVIDEAAITDRQIVASPAKKKTVKKTQDPDTKEVIDDSAAQANGLAGDKDAQTKLAEEAKAMTPAQRRAALKEKLNNRCKTNG